MERVPKDIFAATRITPVTGSPSFGVLPHWGFGISEAARDTHLMPGVMSGSERRVV